MRLVVIAIALLVLGTAGSAEAGRKKYAKAQVTFEVPDAWSEQMDGHRFVVMDAKQEAAVFFASLDAKDLKAAATQLDAKIGEHFSEVKWEAKAKARTLNGMKAAYVEGTGKLKGNLVNLGVLFVGSPTGRVVMATAMVKADKRMDYKATLDKILSSIKADKPALARKTIPEAKISLEIPGEWSEEKKNNYYVLNHPSGDASVVFVPLDAADVQAAAKAMDARLGQLFSELKWAGKGAAKTINGLKAFVVEGTGKFNSKLVNLWVVAVAAPNGKVVVTIVRVDADVRTIYKPIAGKILGSIKAS